MILKRSSFLLFSLATLWLAVGVVATPARTTSSPILHPRAPEYTGALITSFTVSTISASASTTTATCTTATPGKNGYVPPDACNSYWNYDPSFGASIFMAVLFGILSLAHIVQAIVYKKGF